MTNLKVTICNEYLTEVYDITKSIYSAELTINLGDVNKFKFSLPLIWIDDNGEILYAVVMQKLNNNHKVKVEFNGTVEYFTYTKSNEIKKLGGVELHLYGEELESKLDINSIGEYKGFAIKQGKINVSQEKECFKSEFITSAYKRALESINVAIEEMQLIQRRTEYGNSEHRVALESQISLEKTKLELIQNELVNKKSSIFGRPVK